jgi:hemolysin III
MFVAENNCKTRPAMPDSHAPALTRAQTLREEVANAASHGLGLLLAAVSLPVAAGTVQPVVATGPTRELVGAVVFSLTMMLVYFASTVYHALPAGRVKQAFQRLDHAAIFVFIAGSYTPFALHGLQHGGTLGGLLLVWGLALAGVAVKAGGRLNHPLVSTLLYMALGWLALFAALPVVQRLAPGALWLVVGGGLAYTVGAVFFLLDHRLRYAHFVWHLFVLAGSACHFFAALRPWP